MASMSAAFCAMAFRPTSCGDDQSSRKCLPSTSMSVDTTVLPSAGDDDGGVVARTHRDHRRLVPACDEPVDDGELPQPSQAVGRLLARHHTSCRRCLVALNTGRTCGTFGPCGVESMQPDGGDSGWSRLSC